MAISIERRNLGFLGSYTIETNPTGYVDIKDRLAHPDHYVGPTKFASVINLGQTFVELGMRGEAVPHESRWSDFNKPPKGITVLEFEDDGVKTAVDKISVIASEDFYDDEEKCLEYYMLNQIVLTRGLMESGIDIKKAKFMGLVRAGAVAGEMLGVHVDDQVLIQTKRLALKGEQEGDIAIGITYFDENQIDDLDGKDWVIADPAGATYGSIVANISYLAEKGIKPAKLVILNTVGSHKGMLFAQKSLKELGIDDVQIIVGGYSPEMNDDYYLVAPNGQPSVRDAGNGLNRFLPPLLRLSSPK